MENDIILRRSSDIALDDADQNYFTGLCTLFVATIQETKDRVLQLEAIFCGKLFPTFQTELAKWRNICKRLERIQNEAEETWKQERQAMVAEIGNLQVDKRRIGEQYQALKKQNDELFLAFETEKQEIIKSHNLEKQHIVAKIQNMNNGGQELNKIKENLQQKSRDIEEARLAQAKLTEDLKRMQEELRIEKLKQEFHLSEVERERNLKQEVIYQFKSLKKMYRSLRAQYDVVLSLKGAGVDKNNSDKKRSHNGKQINVDTLKQKSLLDYQPDSSSQSKAFLKEEIVSAKALSYENEQGKHMQQSLQEKTGSLWNPRLQTNMGNEDSRILPVKEEIVSVKNEINEDQRSAQTVNKGINSVESREYVKKKYGKDTENEDETREQRGREKRASDGFRGGKNEDKSTSPKRLQPQKRPFEAQHRPDALHRKNSTWRETRSHNGSGMNADPHDDFLDTPMENALQNLKQNNEISPNDPDYKSAKLQGKLSPKRDQFCNTGREVHLASDLGSTSDEDNDETQPFDPNHLPNRTSVKSVEPLSNLPPVRRKGSPERSKEETKRHADKNGIGYKYIEPVRKKADRELLKGVQCNQCKKFYDAVKDDNGGGANNCCEGHADVSRHRYRYAPPATPEGFWNIGFDSDL